MDTGAPRRASRLASGGGPSTPSSGGGTPALAERLHSTHSMLELTTIQRTMIQRYRGGKVHAMGGGAPGAQSRLPPGSSSGVLRPTFVDQTTVASSTVDKAHGRSNFQRGSDVGGSGGKATNGVATPPPRRRVSSIALDAFLGHDALTGKAATPGERDRVWGAPGAILGAGAASATPSPNSVAAAAAGGTSPPVGGRATAAGSPALALRRAAASAGAGTPSSPSRSSAAINTNSHNIDDVSSLAFERSAKLLSTPFGPSVADGPEIDARHYAALAERSVLELRRPPQLHERVARVVCTAAAAGVAAGTVDAERRVTGFERGDRRVAPLLWRECLNDAAVAREAQLYNLIISYTAEGDEWRKAAAGAGSSNAAGKKSGSTRRPASAASGSVSNGDGSGDGGLALHSFCGGMFDGAFDIAAAVAAAGVRAGSPTRALRGSTYSSTVSLMTASRPGTASVDASGGRVVIDGSRILRLLGNDKRFAKAAAGPLVPNAPPLFRAVPFLITERYEATLLAALDSPTTACALGPLVELVSPNDPVRRRIEAEEGPNAAALRNRGAGLSLLPAPLLVRCCADVFLQIQELHAASVLHNVTGPGTVVLCLSPPESRDHRQQPHQFPAHGAQRETNGFRERLVAKLTNFSCATLFDAAAVKRHSAPTLSAQRADPSASPLHVLPAEFFPAGRDVAGLPPEWIAPMATQLPSNGPAAPVSALKSSSHVPDKALNGDERKGSVAPLPRFDLSPLVYFETPEATAARAALSGNAKLPSFRPRQGTCPSPASESFLCGALLQFCLAGTTPSSASNESDVGGGDGGGPAATSGRSLSMSLPIPSNVPDVGRGVNGHGSNDNAAAAARPSGHRPTAAAVRPGSNENAHQQEESHCVDIGGPARRLCRVDEIGVPEARHLIECLTRPSPAARWLPGDGATHPLFWPSSTHAVCAALVLLYLGCDPDDNGGAGTAAVSSGAAVRYRFVRALSLPLQRFVEGQLPWLLHVNDFYDGICRDNAEGVRYAYENTLEDKLQCFLNVYRHVLKHKTEAICRGDAHHFATLFFNQRFPGMLLQLAQALVADRADAERFTGFLRQYVVAAESGVSSPVESPSNVAGRVKRQQRHEMPDLSVSLPTPSPGASMLMTRRTVNPFASSSGTRFSNAAASFSGALAALAEAADEWGAPRLDRLWLFGSLEDLYRVSRFFVRLSADAHGSVGNSQIHHGGGSGVGVGGLGAPNDLGGFQRLS